MEDEPIKQKKRKGNKRILQQIKRKEKKEKKEIKEFCRMLDYKYENKLSLSIIYLNQILTTKNY